MHQERSKYDGHLRVRGLPGCGKGEGDDIESVALFPREKSRWVIWFLRVRQPAHRHLFDAVKEMLARDDGRMA